MIIVSHLFEERAIDSVSTSQARLELFLHYQV